MGTYGIVPYSVSLRRGEVGLRMVLREALGIVASGTMLGAPGAPGARSE